jgi:DNA-binding NtrC family response regulator
MNSSSTNSDWPDRSDDARAASLPRARLNLLLSYGGWRSESWADQLPRLLDPVGIHSIKVECGRQAEDVIRAMPVHIAVIDLRIPLDVSQGSERLDASGPRILQLLRRLQPSPPTIVVREAQPVERERARGLAAALREGAYSVLDHPVRLETLLELLRRITRRYYADLWPA